MIQICIKRFSSVFLMDLLIILFSLVWAIFHSLNEIINIPSHHLDGAYQTSSGLYRLDAGQYPGKDFYPYLGIGPLYLLYPLFKALGSNIASSVFSAYLTVTVVQILSVSFIWHMLWKPKYYINSISNACACFIVLVFSWLLISLGVNKLFNLSMSLDIFHYLKILTPGNSLRPLRSFAPYLTIILFYFLVFKITNTTTKYKIAGIITGLILLWSNDYAITTGFLFVVLVISHALTANKSKIKNILLYIVFSVFTLVILYFLVTHGHPLELLKYNFIDVAQNQWWYFPPLNESSRIFTIAKFAHLFIYEGNTFAFIIITILSFFALKLKSIEYLALLWTGIALFAGGLVASIGGHYDHGYFFPLYLWFLTIIAVKILHFTNHKLTLKTIKFKILIFSMIFLHASLTFYKYSQALSDAKEDTNRFFVNELGGYLTKEWLDYIELARKTPSSELVAEEYWGIWSAMRKSFFIWPVDATIHALGNTLTISKEKIKNADIIITTRYSTSPEWQPWLLSQNYWLYEYLFNEWSIDTVSPTTIVWKKTMLKQQENAPAIECKSEKHIISINAPNAGYYQVDLDYLVTEYKRSLILVKNNINFAYNGDGYISINPKSTTLSFPVYFNTKGQSNLDIKIIGNNTTDILLSSCKAKLITFNDKEVLSPRIYDTNSIKDLNK